MSESKRVLITGASSGFGADTVKALAQKGHTVYATMRGVTGKNADKAAALSSWAEAGGHGVHVLELDVTDQASVDRAVSEAIEGGGIDVVINNAGVGNWGIDEGYSVEQAQQLFNVNLFGAMRVTRAALPHLREAGKGLIVYVGSGLGRIVFPFVSIYAASKFALEGYAESASHELAPHGIQTVIVEPGAYGTSFLTNTMQPADDKLGSYGPVDGMFKAFNQGFEEMAKAGMIGDPSEVVAVLVEEVERPAGDRPLRRVVGKDIAPGVSAINDTCAAVQGEILKAFGM